MNLITRGAFLTINLISKWDLVGKGIIELFDSMITIIKSKPLGPIAMPPNLHAKFIVNWTIQTSTCPKLGLSKKFVPYI